MCRAFYTQEYSQRIAALRTLWDEGLLDPDFMNVNCGRPSGVDRFLLGQAACIVYPTSVHVLQSELMHLWAQLYPDTPMEEKVEAFFPALRRRRAIFRIPRAEHVRHLFQRQCER